MKKRMTKRMTNWILGGVFAISAAGMIIGTNIGSAAEINANQSSAVQGSMMKDGQMGGMNHEMMNASQMEKHCKDMMKDPNMQQAMKGMMKQPEMQAMMKQMLASDPELRQIMSDLINSIEPNDQSSNSVSATTSSTAPSTVDHSAHH